MLEGDAGGKGTGTGKRGRPPKGGGTTTRVRATSTSNATQEIASLKNLFQVMFKAPAHLGYGAHWPLSEYEADKLASDTQAALQAVPSKYTRALTKGLGTAAPFLALAWTAGVIINSRVEQTQKLIAQHRAAVEAEANGNDATR